MRKGESAGEWLAGESEGLVAFTNEEERVSCFEAASGKQPEWERRKIEVDDFFYLLVTGSDGEPVYDMTKSRTDPNGA